MTSALVMVLRSPRMHTGALDAVTEYDGQQAVADRRSIKSDMSAHHPTFKKGTVYRRCILKMFTKPAFFQAPNILSADSR